MGIAGIVALTWSVEGFASRATNCCADAFWSKAACASDPIGYCTGNAYAYGDEAIRGSMAAAGVEPAARMRTFDIWFIKGCEGPMAPCWPGPGIMFA